MTEKNEGNTALQDDAIVDVGDAGPGLALVTAEAPEGAFFSAELYTAIDNGFLKQLGENVDSTGIIEGVMVHLGLLDTQAETDAWAAYMESLSNRAVKLADQQTKLGGLDDAKLLELASQEREIELIRQRLDRQAELHRRITLAKDYYESNIALDFDKIEHIYDITDTFEGATLLTTVKHIGVLLKPRRDARGGSRSHPNQPNVVEAERIIRILVADENDLLEE